MNPSFTNFLNALSESDFQSAYSFISTEYENPIDDKIAKELRAICTSHFIRQRSSKLSGLINLKKSGFNPSVVFDVGAQIGTPELYTVFPDAHHVFIEPVTECLPSLNQIANQLSSARVINCAVSNMNGFTSLSVTPSRQYSSIETNVGNETRTIEVKTLDSIFDEVQINGPMLLKIDVDGIEVKVLKGSKTILKNDSVIVIEASMADDYPRFSLIVEYLQSFGYEVYDIVDPLYRQTDWHLWQVDLIFIKKNSPYWGSKHFS